MIMDEPGLRESPCTTTMHHVDAAAAQSHRGSRQGALANRSVPDSHRSADLAWLHRQVQASPCCW